MILRLSRLVDLTRMRTLQPHNYYIQPHIRCSSMNTCNLTMDLIRLSVRQYSVSYWSLNIVSRIILEIHITLIDWI